MFKRTGNTKESLHLGNNRYRSKIEGIRFTISYQNQDYVTMIFSDFELKDFNRPSDDFWKNIAIKMKEIEKEYINKDDLHTIRVEAFPIGEFTKKEVKEIQKYIGRIPRTLKKQGKNIIKISSNRNIWDNNFTNINFGSDVFISNFISLKNVTFVSYGENTFIDGLITFI